MKGTQGDARGEPQSAIPRSAKSRFHGPVVKSGNEPRQGGVKACQGRWGLSPTLIPVPRDDLKADGERGQNRGERLSITHVSLHLGAFAPTTE